MDWKNSIVRIVGENNRTLGTGFVATLSGLVITASHVIRPGSEVSADAPVVQSIKIAFSVQPEVAYDSTVECELIWGEGDIAVLKMDTPLPNAVIVPPLGKTLDVTQHNFVTRGYPIQAGASMITHENASGIIEGITSDQRSSPRALQITSSNVRRGYSGAPVWDQQRQCVVGVISFITLPDEHGRARDQVYATSLDLLFDECEGVFPSEICPFKGLDTFTEADADYFFGRESEVEESINRLIKHRQFLAVLGPSGSGKSSLVRAAILPAVKAGKVHDSKAWDIIVIRPKEDPFIQLQAFLPTTDSLITGIQKHLENHKDITRVVLVIDQFEQLFTGAGSSIKQAFVQALSELLESDLAVTVIITLRSDFRGAVNTSSANLAKHIQQHSTYLSQEFTSSQLKDIIEKPAQAVGLKFEMGLVSQLIQDAQQTIHLSANDEPSERQRATLPLLEFALERLWHHWYQGAADNVLSMASYESIGGIAGSLNQWADTAYRELDKSPVVKRIFLDLTYVSNNRFTARQRTVKELTRSQYEKTTTEDISGFKQIVRNLPVIKRFIIAKQQRLENWQHDKENTLSIVESLATKRLLVTDAKLATTLHGNETVEIIHDALLNEWETLFKWLHENRYHMQARQDYENRAIRWVTDNSADLLGHKDYQSAKMSLKAFELLPEQNHQIDMPLRRYMIASWRRLALITSAFVFVAMIIATIAGLTGIWEWQVFQAKTRATGDTAEIYEVELGKTSQTTSLAPFEIELYEVTYAQYRLCDQFGPCSIPVHDWPKEDGLNYDYSTAPDDYPVQSVTAIEAATFCDWIGRRLPTAFEFEFAVRGWEQNPFPWGTVLPDQDIIRVNMFVENLFEVIVWDNLSPVAVDDAEYRGSATSKGVMHLLGNVREWTSTSGDCDGLCSQPWSIDDELPGKLQLMGHSYVSGQISEDSIDDEQFLFDDFAEPDFPDETIGFRCAKSK